MKTGSVDSLYCFMFVFLILFTFSKALDAKWNNLEGILQILAVIFCNMNLGYHYIVTIMRGSYTYKFQMIILLPYELRQLSLFGLIPPNKSCYL